MVFSCGNVVLHNRVVNIQCDVQHVDIDLRKSTRTLRHRRHFTLSSAHSLFLLSTLVMGDSSFSQSTDSSTNSDSSQQAPSQDSKSVPHSRLISFSGSVEVSVANNSSHGHLDGSSMLRGSLPVHVAVNPLQKPKELKYPPFNNQRFAGELVQENNISTHPQGAIPGNSILGSDDDQ